jgi:hypothetical protein
MRPTHLDHGVYKDSVDYGIFWKTWKEWAQMKELP